MIEIPLYQKNCFRFRCVSMSMEQSKCFYHYTRIAVEKCEICHRLICLEDKMIFRQQCFIIRLSDNQTFDRTYSYCPICNL